MTMHMGSENRLGLCLKSFRIKFGLYEGSSETLLGLSEASVRTQVGFYSGSTRVTLSRVP